MIRITRLVGVVPWRKRPRGVPIRRGHVSYSKGGEEPLNSIAKVLLRPALFTSAVCLASFGTVAVWDYEQWRFQKEQQEKRSGGSMWKRLKRSLRGREKEAESANNNNTPLAEALATAKSMLPLQVRESLEAILSDPRAKTVGPIILANVLLHALFCVPGMNVLKARYFVHRTGSGQVLPLLLSTFAHGNIVHLGFNCFVLWNFGDLAVPILGNREQFWAAYLSAGTLASLGSTATDLTMRGLRGFPLSAGLGASGAIYALVFATALTFPDLKFGIMGLPYMLPAREFVQYLAAFDFCGLVLGWRVLGHGAHLTGAAAGYCAVETNLLGHISLYQRRVREHYVALKKWAASQ